MQAHLRLIHRFAAILAIAVLCGGSASAEPVAVHHAEGVVHGFLALHSMNGTLLANGDLIQTARGDRVTSRLVFHFKDGSLLDETAVFSQRQTFRLLRDHLIQKGPTFPKPQDVTIDCTSGQVTVRYTDDHGAAKVDASRMTLPPDLANGMILILLKNIQPVGPKTLSMLAATPKPRLVKLAITSAGDEAFALAESARVATHYVVKIEIGGLTGIIAPLVGKQPPDTHVWVLQGEAPAFVKMEGALFLDGPIWRIELVSPVWK